MSEELYYRHYFLQIYEILREDEQNKKLSIKEKNVLADDDEILKGGMKAPVRTLYEELKADKNITSSQKFIPGVEAYRPITWNDALYGNKMTEDDGFMDALKSTAATLWNDAGSDTPSGDIDRIEAAIKKREEEHQLRQQIRQEILQELQQEPDPEQEKMNEIYSKYGVIAKVVNDDVE